MTVLRPKIQIALYEYGNDGLPSSEGYIRMVSGFTSDLDLISEKLFSLEQMAAMNIVARLLKPH